MINSYGWFVEINYHHKWIFSMLVLVSVQIQFINFVWLNIQVDSFNLLSGTLICINELTLSIIIWKMIYYPMRIFAVNFLKRIVKLQIYSWWIILYVSVWWISQPWCKVGYYFNAFWEGMYFLFLKFLKLYYFFKIKFSFDDIFSSHDFIWIQQSMKRSINNIKWSYWKVDRV